MPEIETGLGKYLIDNHPDTCPVCNHSMEMILINAFLIGEPEERDCFMDIAYKCVRHDCARLFISVYRRLHSDQYNRMCGNFFHIKSFPQTIVEPSLSTEAIEISPSFQKIYIEAHTAEIYELNEIAGVGYRKALEFLIKDYCINLNPDKSEEIKSKFLGAVIEGYVQDENLKACAKRAAWLGNDETHYVKKWENKDIEDLKALINLTCAWVSTNVLTKRYMDEMA